MKKCYIAGKIGDLKPEDYEARFAQAEKEVMALGFEPVSPLKLPHKHGKSWEEYMREDLTAMLQCQAVYAIENWTDSRGATIEVELAEKVGIPVIQKKVPKKSYPSYSEWLEKTWNKKCYVHAKEYLRSFDGSAYSNSWRCMVCGELGVDKPAPKIVDNISDVIKVIKQEILLALNAGNDYLEASLTQDIIAALMNEGYDVEVDQQHFNVGNKPCKITWGRKFPAEKNTTDNLAWDRTKTLDILALEFREARDKGVKEIAKNLVWRDIEYFRKEGWCVIVPGISHSENPEIHLCQIRLTGHVYDHSLNMKGEQWYCKCGKFAAEEIL